MKLLLRSPNSSNQEGKVSHQRKLLDRPLNRDSKQTTPKLTGPRTFSLGWMEARREWEIVSNSVNALQEGLVWKKEMKYEQPRWSYVTQTKILIPYDLSSSFYCFLSCLLCIKLFGFVLGENLDLSAFSSQSSHFWFTSSLFHFWV
uniref:Uncharacterized protein n=2 Tax=Beta vulgaris TaxID=161934 RepID=A0A286T8K4_BETVV|nr:hypothetical protein [Beta vulgaris subsp. vulgaris]CBL52024.1 hypothetical protein [Beta vulgaris subsp. maritima]